MADPMDTLKSILGDNAEDTIKSVVDSLSGGGEGNNSSGYGAAGGGSRPGGPANIDPENLAYLMQMRDIMTKLTESHNDSRSNLLMSLKPYMRDTRKKSIDSAVRLLNISKLAGLFRM